MWRVLQLYYFPTFENMLFHGFDVVFVSHGNATPIGWIVLALLGNIAIRRKIKQTKLKTLHKQCDKLIKQLEALGKSDEDINDDTNTAPPAPPNHQPQEVELKCCNCGVVGCLGDCYELHGLKRKQVLEEEKKPHETTNMTITKGKIQLWPKNWKKNAHLQEQKQLEQQEIINHLVDLQLAKPPSFGQNIELGLRVSIPWCTHVLQIETKGKRCGRALLPAL
jgi:hypothetical protein